MQLEATTAELAELLGVSEKTICSWAKHGIMEKLAHRKYDLGASLRNWVEYKKCAFEGYDHPMDVWLIRRDERWLAEESAWSEEERARRYAELEAKIEALPLDAEGGSVTDAYVELVGEELPMRTFEVELDGEGRITRVIGEAKG
jgi:DNA-binding XRE family transcriptional regulator